MATVLERLATIEQMLRDVNTTLQERLDGESSSRRRLHDLEGAVGAWTQAQKLLREAEAKQYRRLEIRTSLQTLAVSVLSLVLAVLAIAIHFG